MATRRSHPLVDQCFTRPPGSERTRGVRGHRTGACGASRSCLSNLTPPSSSSPELIDDHPRLVTGRTLRHQLMGPAVCWSTPRAKWKRWRQRQGLSRHAAHPSCGRVRRGSSPHEYLASAPTWRRRVEFDGICAHLFDARWKAPMTRADRGGMGHLTMLTQRPGIEGCHARNLLSHSASSAGLMHPWSPCTETRRTRGRP